MGCRPAQRESNKRRLKMVGLRRQCGARYLTTLPYCHSPISHRTACRSRIYSPEARKPPQTSQTTRLLRFWVILGDSGARRPHRRLGLGCAKSMPARPGSLSHFCSIGHSESGATAKRLNSIPQGRAAQPGFHCLFSFAGELAEEPLPIVIGSRDLLPAVAAAGDMVRGRRGSRCVEVVP